MLYEPGDMTFRPRKFKRILLVLLSLLLIPIAFLMIRDGESVGWFIVGVVVIGDLFTIATILPNSSYLRVTGEGFEMRSLYRSSFLKWNEVEVFGVGKMGGKAVFFNYSAEHKKYEGVKHLNKSLTNAEGMIPNLIHSEPPEKLAELLNSRKEKFEAERGLVKVYDNPVIQK